MKSVCIVGGAGFIGTHFSRVLLETTPSKVFVVDNLSSGGRDRLKLLPKSDRLVFEYLDASNCSELSRVFSRAEVDTVIHLASNPDIAAAATQPSIDFVNGTVITESVVEAARRSGVTTVLYASGSGVYGDYGESVCDELSTIPRPVSTYGASKLAGEALISAYSHMYGIRGLAFRFGNVVGPNATHGVCYDFVNRLHLNPTRLQIRGNGTQSKSYVHISDVIDGVLVAERATQTGFEVFNIATRDYITVREIAEKAVITGNLKNLTTVLQFETAPRGWLGDVPVVRLSSERIRSLGWCNKYSCAAAVENALICRWDEVRKSDDDQTPHGFVKNKDCGS